MAEQLRNSKRVHPFRSGVLRALNFFRRRRRRWSAGPIHCKNGRATCCRTSRTELESCCRRRDRRSFPARCLCQRQSELPAFSLILFRRLRLSPESLSRFPFSHSDVPRALSPLFPASVWLTVSAMLWPTRFFSETVSESPWASVSVSAFLWISV